MNQPWGAAYVNVEIVCRDLQEHRRRIDTRAATVPGLKLPIWEQVLARDYRPWSEARLVIDTGGKSVEQSLQELLQKLATAATTDLE